jgi:hypothetical protein
MKRFTLLATAVVGLALGAAACSDSPVQPTEPTAGLATDVSPSLSIVPNRLDACSLFLPAALCSEPRATLCAAFIAGADFDVTNRNGMVIATIIIEPNPSGAEVRIEAPGRRTVKFQIGLRTIQRLCGGGSGGGGGDDR